MKKLFFSLLIFSSTCFSLTFDASVPKALRKKLTSDLNFVYQIKASSPGTPLHQEIYGPVSGASYKKFFQDRVKEIGLDDCGGEATACAKLDISKTKIFLSQRFIESQIPSILRIMTLFHEARHLEEDFVNWPHELCPTPFLDENGKDIVGIWSGQKLEGQEACEWSVYGAYATSAIMLNNISKYCTNCSEEFKGQARLYALDITNRVVDAESKSKMLMELMPLQK